MQLLCVLFSTQRTFRILHYFLISHWLFFFLHLKCLAKNIFVKRVLIVHPWLSSLRPVWSSASYNVNINLLSRRSFCRLIHLEEKERREVKEPQSMSEKNCISDRNAKSSLVNGDLGVVEDPPAPQGEKLSQLIKRTKDRASCNTALRKIPSCKHLKWVTAPPSFVARPESTSGLIEENETKRADE